MKLIYGLLVVVGLSSCASQPETLTVASSQLRDQERDGSISPMVLMEQQRHLLGAISMEERKQRLGQYYDIHWHDEAGVGKGPVEVVFLYQQGKSGSKVKRMVKGFGAEMGAGSVEFAVIGDDYLKNGKVLAWKAEVKRSGRVLASKQSYLWR